MAAAAVARRIGPRQLRARGAARERGERRYWTTVAAAEEDAEEQAGEDRLICESSWNVVGSTACRMKKTQLLFTK